MQDQCFPAWMLAGRKGRTVPGLASMYRSFLFDPRIRAKPDSSELAAIESMMVKTALNGQIRHCLSTVMQASFA